MTETERTSSRPLVEGRALLAAIDQLPPEAPTACAGWTAHDIAAHLAAGAKETADLIDERLDGRPVRPTRRFEEREAPFRAMGHDELRARLVAENVPMMAAWGALAERTADPAIAFTGALVTVDELEMHARSEAALHRWDLVGDDDTSDRLLAQPELTAHAVEVLNRMPVLTESARSLGVRAREAGLAPLRLSFRSPDQPDAPDGCETEVALDRMTGSPGKRSVSSGSVVLACRERWSQLLVAVGSRRTEAVRGGSQVAGELGTGFAVLLGVSRIRSESGLVDGRWYVVVREWVRSRT